MHLLPKIGEFGIHFFADLERSLNFADNRRGELVDSVEKSLDEDRLQVHKVVVVLPEVYWIGSPVVEDIVIRKIFGFVQLVGVEVHGHGRETGKVNPSVPVDLLDDVLSLLLAELCVDKSFEMVLHVFNGDGLPLESNNVRLEPEIEHLVSDQRLEIGDKLESFLVRDCGEGIVRVVTAAMRSERGVLMVNPVIEHVGVH